MSQDPIRHIRISSLFSNSINFIKENNTGTDLFGMNKELSNLLFRISDIFVKNFWSFDWYEIHFWLMGYRSCKHSFGTAWWSIKKNSFRRSQSSFYIDIWVLKRELDSCLDQVFSLLVTADIIKREWLKFQKISLDTFIDFSQRLVYDFIWKIFFCKDQMLFDFIEKLENVLKSESWGFLRY